MLSGHPPGGGSGSSARGAATLAALRSWGETIHAVSFAADGEGAFADPEVILLPRPGPNPISRRLTAPAGRGTFYLTESRGRLLQRIASLVDEGRLLPRYDLVWAHSSLMARAGLESVHSLHRVLDIDNIAGAEVLRRAEGLSSLSPRKFYRLLDGHAIAREERRRCEAYDHVVVTSAEERDRLGELGTPVTIVPNTVASDAEPVSPGTAPPRILFVGSLHYEPNVDALEHLFADILPSVRSEHPEVRVTVAGRNPTPAVENMCRDADVELVANAPSLDSLYRGARLVVAPLRLGGGTRVKLLEAMAYGAAIVATETAAEGLALEEGANARVAKTPDAFARACSDLLADPDAAGRIGAAARETWLRLYTPEVAHEAVLSLVKALRSTTPKSDRPTLTP